MSTASIKSFVIPLYFVRMFNIDIIPTDSTRVWINLPVNIKWQYLNVGKVLIVRANSISLANKSLSKSIYAIKQLQVFLETDAVCVHAFLILLAIQKIYMEQCAICLCQMC